MVKYKQIFILALFATSFTLMGCKSGGGAVGANNSKAATAGSVVNSSSAATTTAMSSSETSALDLEITQVGSDLNNTLEDIQRATDDFSRLEQECLAGLNLVANDLLIAWGNELKARLAKAKIREALLRKLLADLELIKAAKLEERLENRITRQLEHLKRRYEEISERTQDAKQKLAEAEVRLDAAHAGYASLAMQRLVAARLRLLLSVRYLEDLNDFYGSRLSIDLEFKVRALIDEIEATLSIEIQADITSLHEQLNEIINRVRLATEAKILAEKLRIEAEAKTLEERLRLELEAAAKKAANDLFELLQAELKKIGDKIASFFKSFF